MKKIKYLLSICTLAFLGCNDAIDIQQPGRLIPETTFNSIEDLQRGIIGIYTLYDTTQEIALATNFTDEVAPGVATGGQGFNTGFVFELNSGSTAPFRMWIDGYIELFSINTFLVGLDAYTPSADEQAEYNNIRGQALAFRAYSHFQLLSYFSTDYADDNALGVPIQTSVPGLGDQPLRDTNGDVYAAIEQDLDDAQTLLSDMSSATSTFISRDFVSALRARIAAYRGDYTTALPLAQDLVNRYPLATRAEFTGIWLDNSNAEIIFKLERSFNGPFDFQGASGSVAAGGWAGNMWAFVNATAGGGAYYEFSRNLFNLFDPADVRYDAYLAPSSVVSPDYQNAVDFVNEDVLVVQKYPGSEGQFLMNDLKVFRSAEMLLIQAEAYADANSLNGGSASVAAAIKQLRDARYGSPQALPTYTTQTEAFAAILNERRVEFAFEGHRWKDIKRLGARANQNIVRDPLDCAQFNVCELNNNDFRLTLPIPLTEFNGNPGLREQQNPGYGN
ncbi:RagB/SusD family nutrient uptake outer membrane protein [Winogradskyella haliclonae]|nr:RagB/SusD family nutrient uptake outer membrane protein [Winogradskyella haliclonae]